MISIFEVQTLIPTSDKKPTTDSKTHDANKH
jgi:hypothetical protein